MYLKAGREENRALLRNLLFALGQQSIVAEIQKSAGMLYLDLGLFIGRFILCLFLAWDVSLQAMFPSPLGELWPAEFSQWAALPRQWRKKGGKNCIPPLLCHEWHLCNWNSSPDQAPTQQASQCCRVCLVIPGALSFCSSILGVVVASCFCSSQDGFSILYVASQLIHHLCNQCLALKSDTWTI